MVKKPRTSHNNPPPKYKKQHNDKRAAATTTATAATGATAPAPAAAKAVGMRTPGETTPQPSEPSTVFTLLPMAPLICRSGRPFDDQAGADSARFPPPSTVAGCVRTAWAREQGQDPDQDLMQLQIRGPILARPDATALHCYAPRPADALYFGQGDQAHCVRAEPRPFDPGCGADLPDDLLPVQLIGSPDGKETKGPDWWVWEDLLAYRAYRERPTLSPTELSDHGGWSAPKGDRRTHVAIDRSTLAARTGQLFQTEGLDLSPPRGLKDDPTSDFRLLVKMAQPLGSAMAHLGGERRLARIEPRDASAWPSMPDGWVERIQADGGLVLTLLTPALFAKGYRPGWLAPQGGDGNPTRLVGSPPGLPGLKLTLRAAALGRWQPHSGWDLTAQQPRAGRKLVPAGAVYWFAIADTASDQDLADLWLASLCDHEQDRRDGFGLALPAPWQPPENISESNTQE